MRILTYTVISLIISCSSLELSFCQIDTNWFTNLEYRSLGPNRGGRSNAVAGVTSDRNLYYMGTAGGGVWKTENGGTSWTNISDGFFGGSIGSVMVAPSDDNIIYVGQGEETVRGNVSSGKGIWKSNDAGITWEFKGLENSRHVPAIVVHPENADIAFAAVLGDLYKDSEERGVYKTIDGGNTWQKVLYSNAGAGCNDITFDPLNKRVLYATTWKLRRTPYSLSSGGEGSALWKSTDGGDTWTSLNDREGLPKGTLGKITVSASPVKKNLVFAMVEHKSKGGLYKSSDGGKTWTQVNDDAAIRQRAWYFSRIICDTKDENIIYTANVRFLKSSDGGKNFASIRTPHADHHGLWIDPNDNQRMIVADDGGGQVSYNGGGTWSTYHNQPTEQFYRVTTDNHVPYRIYGAQQDNSTMRVNHISGRYENTAGGESAHIAPDPTNPEIVYAGSYGGYLTRLNHETHDNRGINVWPNNPMGGGAEDMKYRFQWNFPLFFSPHNPQKLYTASNHLHVSMDEGNSWQVISPDLTTNDAEKLKSSGGPITKDNTGVEYYCTIFAAVESALEKDLIYVGSDDGLIHLTKNAGTDWKNITPKQMPKGTMINCIEVDPFVKGRVYVVATSYKSGDYSPYLYVSSDYGSSWNLRANGIAKDHFLRVVRSDKQVPNLLYAGTELGMYISFDAGKNWSVFQKNLPVVPITDLALAENDLVVATQGRGFWILDNLDAVRKAGSSCPKQLTVISAEGRHLVRGAKATISFFMPDTPTKEEKIVLDVLDGNEEVIKTWSSGSAQGDTGKLKVKKGVNYVNWNLRYPDAQKPKDMILWWASTGGPRAAPGKYNFRINNGKVTDNEEFSLLVNPKSEGDSAAQKAKFEFLHEVIQKVDETHESIGKMKDVKRQIQSFTSKLDREANDSVKKAGKRIIEELDSLMNDLYQTKLKSEQDPINYPIRLNNKLAHLNSLVSMGSMGPTEQAILVKDELIKAIDERLKRFEEIKESSIPQFNELIHELALPIITTE